MVPRARLWAGGRHTSGIRPHCKLIFENDFFGIHDVAPWASRASGWTMGARVVAS